MGVYGYTYLFGFGIHNVDMYINIQNSQESTTSLIKINTTDSLRFGG